MPPLGQNFLLAGGSGRIQKFDPVLHTYSAYKNSVGNAYYCMAGDVAGNVIYAAGSGGRLSRSTDGGESWDEISTPAAVDITAIHFISSTEIYIFHGWGHGKLYRYDGSSFTEVDFVDIYSRVWAIWGTSNDLYTGWFYGAYTPFAIRWWNGSIWQTDSSINGGAELRVYGGGRFSDGSSLVAGMASGTCKIYKGSFGDWTLEHSAAEGYLQYYDSDNVIVINPNTDVAYILNALSNGCYLYKRSPAGVYTTYGPYYTPSGAPCTGIALLDDNQVVIGAGDESVVVFDGASFTFYNQGSGNPVTYRSIWAVPEINEEKKMFKKLSGIIGDTLRFGLAGNSIKDHTDGLAVRDNDGSALKNLTVLRPQGANKDGHAGTFADILERAILIEFSFNGNAPPTPGDNTGKYGLCHTSDGSYNAGEIWYDPGSVALTLVPSYKMQVIMTKVAVTGTVNLIDEGIYIAETGTAPFTWTLKGDGGSTDTGLEKVIGVTLTATAGNFDSTTAIPENAVITKVITKVTTPYDTGATIEVKINGSSPVTVQATTENNAEVADTYETGNYEVIGATGTGVVRATLATGGSGAAKVYVHYVTPLA